MRKVLISPGFGAGWSTWNDSELRDDFLFDEKLIAAVESGNVNDAIDDFEARMRVKHDKVYVSTLGGRDLCVTEVDGPFIVEEYDGHESIRLCDATNWI